MTLSKKFLKQSNVIENPVQKYDEHSKSIDSYTNLSTRRLGIRSKDEAHHDMILSAIPRKAKTATQQKVYSCLKSLHTPKIQQNKLGNKAYDLYNCIDFRFFKCERILLANRMQQW